MNERETNLPWLGRKLIWLDKAANTGRMVYALYAVCAVLFLADFFYKKKTYFDPENLPGAYAIFGLVLCAALIFVARGFRALVMRPEDYYAPKGVEAEQHPDHDTSRSTNND